MTGICVEIRRLQRRLRRFLRFLILGFFSALQALGHPFPHVALVTHPRACGQTTSYPGRSPCEILKPVIPTEQSEWKNLVSKLTDD
jgi:hypothetical protein